jgi:hypothetical protein
MAIDNFPGVGPQNTDIANAVAAVVPTNSSIANAVAAAVPTNSSITNIVQTYASGKTYTVQEFNSTTNWTAPTGVNAVSIFLVGGGGGGGGQGSTANGVGSGGGGGGQVFIGAKTVTPGTSYTVTIGAGGSGGTASSANIGNNGSLGGTSSFGNLASAIGGTGGRGYQQNTLPTAGWSGGGGSLSGGAGAAGAGGGAVGDATVTLTGVPTNGSTYVPLTVQNFSFPADSNGGGAGGKASYFSMNSGDFMYVGYGGAGYLGYAGGGGGGARTDGSTVNFTNRPYGRDGGGNGVYPNTTTSFVVGNAGTANRGGGGGGTGGSTSLNNNPQSGYAGGSGYCRIEYFA